MQEDQSLGKAGPNEYKPHGTYPLARNCIESGISPLARHTVLYPWYPLMLLTLEAQSVIHCRLAKIGRGGAQSWDEITLMLAEKSSAAVEAGTALMSGATLNVVVDRLRFHVAANEARLSA